MKLKIERTIDLEDAPGEAKQALSIAIDGAVRVHNLVTDLAQEADKEVMNTQAIHESIHKVREALYEVDLILSDADAILINYQSAKAATAAQEKKLAEQEG
jgi:hypothetical protein|tara:strand:+ start:336 stop:638 length:303 start_codon:yes stop_codon:yes gene_type:complete